MEYDIFFHPIYLEFNQGHGSARRESLRHCHNELVALMDADDISLPNRFENQLAVFKTDDSIDIVGGQITEFIGDPSNIIGKRSVPLLDGDIKSYMKKRCPMNQVSVMFKKTVVEKAGGYQDWYCEEDYYLWLRMASLGAVFSNVEDILVNVRVGNEMSSRRGGWSYFLSEAKLQMYMLRTHVISIPKCIYNIALRFGGEVILSNTLRTKLFRVLRDKVKEQTLVTFEQKEFKKSGFPSFSVAMCVYGKDNAEWFDKAVESVIKQTVPPDEIVLVVDGPVPQSIQDVINKYKEICNGN